MDKPGQNTTYSLDRTILLFLLMSVTSSAKNVILIFMCSWQCFFISYLDNTELLKKFFWYKKTLFQSVYQTW